MADSVYRVTEVVGTSSESWEAAARTAVETAGKTLRDPRRRSDEAGRDDRERRDHGLPCPPRDLVQVRVRRLTDSLAPGRRPGQEGWCPDYAAEIPPLTLIA